MSYPPAPPPPGDEPSREQPPGGYGYPPPPGGPPGGASGGYGDMPPAPPGYGYGGGPAYGPVGTSQKAIWSLVLGVLGLLCCGIFTGIPALILGNMAKKEIAQSGGRLGGAGMAQAGFILGIVACVLGVIGLVLFSTGALNTTFNVDSR